jgi:mannose-1-phosphate guanylyltransferase/mannose-6-phosphate isomerase
MNRTAEGICPVILSGGAGTRLWPLSRQLYPKQFLGLGSKQSLFQATARRVADPALFTPPVIVCNDDHRFLIAEQLREIGIAPRDIVLEPVARNTAPAVAAAAFLLAQSPQSGDELMLVLPSDHRIEDAAALRAAVERAIPAARAGAVVCFGTVALQPETGFGYIRPGDPYFAEAAGESDCRRIARFVEKPGAAWAEAYVLDGGWHWNAGIFLMSAKTALAELEAHAPAVAAACGRAVSAGRKDLDFFRLHRDSLEQAPAISFDHAVMESTARGAVVPLEIAQSDIGSWSSLWEMSEKDESGNVAEGDVIAVDSRGCYLRSEHRLIAAIGVSDVVIVATDDAVLVVPRERSQDVKALVEQMLDSSRDEAVEHRRVYRPWGLYQSVDAGLNYQVKRITVKPGGQLSLQRHRHRAEHWVVVNGTAKVTRGEDIFPLRENESVYIPAGVVHRLENPGNVPLNLIEVQSGSYLAESDIERLEDTYGRC